jgi:nicotinamidase-related amidase
MMRGAPGCRIHPDIEPKAGDHVLEKKASDAFYETGLKELLHGLNVRTIVLAGMQTEFCVDATVRSALSHEFDVVLLSDCHTTGDSTLPAEQIIAHHNSLLPRVVHPKASVRTVSSSGIFT